MHSCDNRPCINPDHLSIGTQLDNIMDSFSRDRGANQKLLRSDVVTIRKRVAGGETQRALAREYGVSPGAINSIIKRRTWAWLADDYSEVRV